jgi:hypothetical protein
MPILSTLSASDQACAVRGAYFGYRGRGYTPVVAMQMAMFYCGA